MQGRHREFEPGMIIHTTALAARCTPRSVLQNPGLAGLTYNGAPSMYMPKWIKGREWPLNSLDAYKVFFFNPCIAQK